MRLTRQGWLVAFGAATLVGAGRFLGLLELFGVGAGLAALVVVCSVWVWLRRIDLAVARVIRPARVHAGNPCTVDIRVRNRAGRPTPVLRLHDPVSGTSGADLLLAPQTAGHTSTVAYRLPTEQRGLVRIGPLVTEVSDPFGLALTRLRAAPRVEITVLPRVDDVRPLPRSAGPDPDMAAGRTASLGRGGDDFVGLRTYVVGDDLRRVHWASSARALDDLLVRQYDISWQGRVTLILDTRRDVHDADTIERAVSAVASIATAHTRRGDLVRLVATDGVAFDEGSGPGHLDALLDYLAVAERSPRGNLRATLDRVGRSATGALVLVTGRPPDSDVEALERVGPSLSYRLVVRLDRTGRTQLGRRTEVLGVGPGESFPDAWDAGR